jgi:UrcA family protein
MANHTQSEIEVHMMNKVPSASFFRNAVVFAAAFCVLALPVIASASILNSSHQAQKAASAVNLDTPEGQERYYGKLKNESRNICGSSSVNAAGSLERATDNEKCFNETLNVAVQRVNNPAVTEIHQNSL